MQVPTSPRLLPAGPPRSFSFYLSFIARLTLLLLQISMWMLLPPGSSPGPSWRVRQYSISLITTLEKAMAPHSSTLAWRTPWTEEPGGLQSMGSRIVRHD